MKRSIAILTSVLVLVVLVGCASARVERFARQNASAEGAEERRVVKSVPAEEKRWFAGATEMPEAEAQVAAEAPAELPTGASPAGNDLVMPAPDRKIVKNATMRLEVENIFSALNQVTLLTSQYGGYVLNSRTWYEQERPYAVMTFAVPAERFEEALEQLRRLGKVLDETTTGQDVTDQYVDLEARIRNLEATANRIRSFLDEARTVEEALRVNEQLRYVEEELERLKAQRNVLERRTAFSTITVELQPLLPKADQEPPPWSPGETFEAAWRVLVRVLQLAVDAAIWVGVLGSPLLLLLVPLWIFGRRLLLQGR